MKKHRNIPFGYQVAGGEIAVNQPEAEIVKYIFREYLNGRSCQSIAEELSGKGIVYRQGTDNWNRSTLKRVLDNQKYAGNGDYPELVAPDVFDRASQIKSNKYTRKNIVPSPIVTALKGKIVCFECGASFNRRYDARVTPKWYCTGHDCQTDFRITDNYLFGAILAILNKVIENPEALTLQDKKPYTSNLEIMRLNNAIGMELEKQEPDKDLVRSLIRECAAKKYECCEDEYAPFTTEKLRAEFKKRHPLTMLDPELIDRTVDTVLVGKSGTILLRLKNSKILSYPAE